MFPSGRPGLALALIRVAVAVMLMNVVASPLLRLGSAWFLLALGAVSLALFVGLTTPIACALVVGLEIANWATSERPIEAVHVCAVLNAIALFMLGPGAYALDARLFGRRQVVFRVERERDDG